MGVRRIFRLGFWVFWVLTSRISDSLKHTVVWTLLNGHDHLTELYGTANVWIVVAVGRLAQGDIKLTGEAF